jgi:hypothetical protein
VQRKIEPEVIGRIGSNSNGFSRRTFVPYRALALLLLLSTACFAQFSSSLQGTVQDHSGAGISAATVTLTNTSTGVAQTTVSDGTGVYRFASLAPGSYQLSSTAAGFNASKTDFTLNTNETRNVPIVLTVGQISATVQVTSEQPLLDTSDSRNQLTLDRQAIDNLPLAARNPLALITLAPGVTGLGVGTATNFNQSTPARTVVGLTATSTSSTVST